MLVIPITKYAIIIVGDQQYLTLDWLRAQSEVFRSFVNITCIAFFSPFSYTIDFCELTA